MCFQEFDNNGIHMPFLPFLDVDSERHINPPKQEKGGHY
jgi:hypothetical protein